MKTPTRRIITSLTTAANLAVFVVPTNADTLFTRIAGMGTPIPGGRGNFTAFNPPAMDDGVVAFKGDGTGGQDGAYVYSNGSLDVIADHSTLIPGRSDTFAGLGEPTTSMRNFAFQGVDNADNVGIYTVVDGVLDVVADTTTDIPGTTGKFTTFGPPSLDDAYIAFAASNVSGIYTNVGGTLHVVADTNSGGYLSFGSHVSLDDGRIAFQGNGSGSQGIYLANGGLSVVADRNTPIPGGTGNFSSIGVPTLDGGTVAFDGGGPGGTGIYTAKDGMFDIVADLTTPIPEGTESFLGFANQPSVDQGNVAFRGWGNTENGIYAKIDGTLMKVVDLNDKLDGKTPSNLWIGPEALDGDRLAFLAEFGGGGSYGIYVATVPEPATFTLLSLGGFALLRRR